MVDEPRIVPLSAHSENEPNAMDKLEAMIEAANKLSPIGDQNGTSNRNSSKEVRARRRAQKLARKKNRYR